LLTIFQGGESTDATEPAGPADQQGAEAQTGTAADTEGSPPSRNLTEHIKAFLAEKMPEERREQIIWRLKKMLIEIQGRSDCK
jgi:hypothetical protein